MIPTQLNANYMGLSRSHSIPARIEGTPLFEGAQTSIYLATSPDVAGVSGQYYVNQRAVRSSAVSDDEALAQRLWQVSADLTGLAG